MYIKYLKCAYIKFKPNIQLLYYILSIYTKKKFLSRGTFFNIPQIVMATYWVQPA